jgi:serine/threonine-protein kinase
MEYIEGVTLQEWLERSKQGHGTYPPLDRTLEMGLQIVELLQYLHCLAPAPIIYRDLKPTNLMLDKQGRIRLIDFGIARTYKPGQLTDTVPLGTVAFAAPEQLSRTQTDPRSDLYSLGALLYYLVSGGRYYTPTQKPIHCIRDMLPTSVSDTIHRMLEVDPEDRFQTAAEARISLMDAISSVSTEVTTNSVNKLPTPTALHKPSTFFHRLVTSLITPFTKIRHSAQPDRPRKIIAVGALYAGAGATFTTIALARTCHRSGIPALVMEAAVKEPELAALLQIPRPSLIPSDPIHSYYDDELGSGLDMHASNRVIGYRTDSTRWVVLNPNPYKPLTRITSSPVLNMDRFHHIMAQTREPIVFVDIADSWTDEGVLQLCREADAVLIVIDPFPSRWDNNWTRSRLEALAKLSEEGYSVSWIMNKDAPHAKRKERMSSIPSPPLCVLPYVGAEQRLYALDQGKLVQDLPKIRSQLTDALKPLMRKLQISEKKL